MRSQLLFIAALLPLGCAVPREPEPVAPAPIQVLVRSHNRSNVEVYVLCGNRDATWLGVVAERESGALEIPAERARCVEGLNFFLVVQRVGRGYWAGPVRPMPGGYVELLIEKYAGLSAARVYLSSR
jgi:hypothetical protein